LACSGKQDQNLETMGGESQPRRTQHEKPDATAARKTRTAAAGPRLRHEPSEEFQICPAREENSAAGGTLEHDPTGSDRRTGPAPEEGNENLRRQNRYRRRLKQRPGENEREL
jgi:hypothetical protein